jgi:hypothetical protein
MFGGNVPAQAELGRGTSESIPEDRLDAYLAELKAKPE